MPSRNVNETVEPPVSNKIYYSNSKACLRNLKCKYHHKMTKKSNRNIQPACKAFRRNIDNTPTF